MDIQDLNMKRVLLYRTGALTPVVSELDRYGLYQQFKKLDGPDLATIKQRKQQYSTVED